MQGNTEHPAPSDRSLRYRFMNSGKTVVFLYSRFIKYITHFIKNPAGLNEKIDSEDRIIAHWSSSGV
jgi:hypothetical protein